MCSLDFNCLLANLDTVAQLDWSLDSSSNTEWSGTESYTNSTPYDPVREAASQNSNGAASSSNTNSTGGGSSEPQGGDNHPADGIRQDTDTKRLGDYLSQCGRGYSTYNCGLEPLSNNHATPQKLFLSRIWAHVKAENPQFISDSSVGPDGTVINAGIVSDSLINNIYNLNKNYPGHWPS